MAVIREDVVRIGFEVENNPFADLASGINGIKAKLGILDNTAEQMKSIATEADLAAKGVTSLTSGFSAPPSGGLAEPVKEAGAAAGAAQEKISGLTEEMGKAGKQKMTEGVDQLSTGIKKPVTGFKTLLGQAKTFAKEALDAGIKQLPPGLRLAITGAGKLLGKLKDVAKLGLKGAVTGVKMIARHAGEAAKALGGKAWSGLKSLGKGVAVGIAAAGTALGVGAVAAFNFGAAYETSLAKVSTIADTAAVSMKELSRDVLNLSNATGEDATGLNEAVYQALSAGADTEGVVDLVGTAVKAAKGGYTDTTTAIDGLTSTLNAYGMATGDAEGLANQFLITQNKGKTTFGELAGSIGTVAPTANAAGVGVDQLLASVASLTANGIGTSEAMTGMKAALSNVIKPSAEATKMAQSLGLEFDTAALQSKGLVGFLEDVKTATGGDTDKMAKLFGSVEALNTVLTLTSDQGSQLMKDTLAEMATNTTALEDAYNTMSDTAQNSVAKGINSFKNLGIAIYQANEGPVSELTGLFAGAGQELYEAFQAGGFEGLTEQIGTTLSNVLTKLTSYLPQLMQAGTRVIQSLVSGIIQNRAQIAQSVTAGITMMLTGILQMAPQILTAGVMMLGSLLNGLESQMPNIISTGLTAIQNLCNGLLQNLPAIIQSGINIIMQLINGLIQAAPTILTTGIQLIITLAQGLVAAIPELVAAIPQLVGAVISALMSVNWLKLGLDIIKGIGSGLIKGIKGLFSKGKDAGKEVGDGVAEGLNESTQSITSAAEDTVAETTENMKPESVKLSDYGVQTISSYGAGMQMGAPQLFQTAGQISAETAGAFGTLDMTNTGFRGTLSLTQGIQQASGAVLGAAQKVGADASEAAQTEIPVEIQTNPAGFEQFTVNTEAMVTDSTAVLQQLPTIYSQTYAVINTVVAAQMIVLSTTMRQGLNRIITDTKSFASGIKRTFAGIQLYQSGVNIMSGLNRGMRSMKPVLTSTAAEIAKSVSNTINQSLEIHSPSRVTEKSGEYTSLGLAKGIRNMSGTVAGEARAVGNLAARNISPIRSRYSPENSSYSSSTSNYSENNTYNPVFHLTLNGASASDSNERRVKRWIKEALAENNASISRKRPRLQEV